MTPHQQQPFKGLLHTMGVVLVAAVVLASCGSGSGSTGGDRSTSTSTPATTVAAATGKDLAATPPMGWNSWNQVRCYDLNEDVVKRAADALVRHGLDKLGYQYVVVDDCWQAPTRAADGSLQANPQRFPSGMKALADYVHAKGLKFGLYLSPGSKTCAMQWDKYPGSGLGSFGHERQDAEMLAKVGVDYLKYDWCAADTIDGLDPKTAFAQMRGELDRLKRPIFYSISEYGKHQPWTWAPGIAQMWRTTSDIQPNWRSIAHIIDSQADLAEYARPGAWNDPDMLQVGNGKLTDAEIRAHIGMWAMLAAPLMIGTDLDKASPAVLATLSNPEVIAIDQDALGHQARRVSSEQGREIWVRTLANGDLAVALLNSGDGQAQIGTDLAQVGADAGTWKVRDVWNRSDTEPTDSTITRDVQPHAMVLLRLSR